MVGGKVRWLRGAGVAVCQVVDAMKRHSGSSGVFALRKPIAGLDNRLKLININGSYSYSSILKMQNVHQNKISITTGPSVNLATNLKAVAKATLTVTDVQGHTVMQKDLVLPAGISVIPIYELNDKATGMYLVKLKYGTKSWAGKVIR